jgi:GTP diphosphokinase / guanosine-3',5'-bis(diphosphate) 3'-diphosphatase
MSTSLNNLELNKDYQLLADKLYKELQENINYLSNADQDKVQLAFYQMQQAHENQFRKSGDYYIVHPFSACLYLARMKLDCDTLCAALLHDVPEDTNVTMQDLQENFSKEVVFLVSGITKLGKIKYQGEDRYAENLRRMFVAMSQDLRVIFIKLADRLHNLTTLEHLPSQKAYRIALESLEIYVPIAQRLGINYFKGEIEDAAFPYVYPEEFKKFHSISEVEINRRQQQVGSMIKKMTQALSTEELTKYQLKGRAKRYYSLYKKLQQKELSLADVYDLVALRIVTDNIEECYKVLSLVHKNFTPVGDRMKDYIAIPKDNGYKSIHTTVIDPDSGQIFEVQIRTKEMNEHAEYGVAAHWAYKNKSQNTTKEQFLNPENLKWITELVDIGKSTLSSEEYLQHVKLDLFQDRIFVMTPKGDVINLPEGATPIDFAYKIHEQIGSRAVRAIVNNNPIKLTDSLQNGDVVMIQTDKNQTPKRDWLQHVKTHQAVHQIRYKLRKLGL